MSEEGKEVRVLARLAWNNWPDNEQSRQTIAEHELRDPASAEAWDRVIDAISMKGSAPVTERDAYNDGYTHEAMHAAHMCCDMWSSHVLETRCADEFPDVKAAIEQAAEAMYNVYQLTGRKFTD